MASYDKDGIVKVTVVDGTTYTGLFANDGSLNVVYTPNIPDQMRGAYHACGALWVTDAPAGTTDQYAPDGSKYVSTTGTNQNVWKVYVVNNLSNVGGGTGDPTGPVPTTPVNLTPPSINFLTPVVGQVVDVNNFSPGTWSGYPVPTFSYQLYANDVAKATPYTVLAGDALKVTVTATNSAGTAIATSAATNAAASPSTNTQYANASNTGIPAGTTLTGTRGDTVVTTPNTIIENTTINGTITVQTTGVEIRNCKINCAGGYGVRVIKGYSAYVHHCEINGGDSSAAGIGGCGTFEYNNIHNCENAINIEGWLPTKIHYNYLHTFTSTPNTNHKDGIQIFGEDAGGGMQDVEVIGNTVIQDGDPDGVSCIYVANTFGPVSRVMIRNNYVSGGSGSFPMYYSGQGSAAYPMTNVVYKDNYIGRGFYGYFYDVPGGQGNEATYIGNLEVATPVAVEQAPWIVDGVQQAQGTAPNTGTDTTPPVIGTSSAFTIVSGNSFSTQLTANETATWSIVGGADQAQFTIVNGSTLSMASKNYASPVDSDGDNTYVVTVQATDASGNASTKTITVTVASAAVTSSLYYPSTTPPLFEHNDSGGVTITQGTQLYFSQAGHVKSILFYWANQTGAASPSGTVGLYDGSGTLLSSASYSGLTGAAGWKVIDLPAPVAVSANTMYVPTMYQPRGSDARFHYPYSTTFGSAQVSSSDGKIIQPAKGAVANGVTYNNGRYGYNASAAMIFPTNTFNSEGYFVDVIYTP